MPIDKQMQLRRDTEVHQIANSLKFDSELLNIASGNLASLSIRYRLGVYDEKKVLEEFDEIVKSLENLENRLELCKNELERLKKTAPAYPNRK